MLDLTSDLDVLGATIYGEARGETALGKQAVAAVAMNRVAYAAVQGYPEFGDGSVRSACLFPWQFSCWNKQGPNHALILSLSFTEPSTELRECLNFAHDALNESSSDPTRGCLFYKKTALTWPKDWGKQVPADVVIGRQSFYRLGITVPAKKAPAAPALTAAPQEVNAEPRITFWQRLWACFT